MCGYVITNLISFRYNEDVQYVFGNIEMLFLLLVRKKITMTRIKESKCSIAKGYKHKPASRYVFLLNTIDLY